MANINIKDLQCPVCDEKLAVDSEQETDWKHGVVNVHLQLTDESLEHLQNHINTLAADDSSDAGPDAKADDASSDIDAKADAGDGSGDKEQSAPGNDEKQTPPAVESKPEGETKQDASSATKPQAKKK